VTETSRGDPAHVREVIGEAALEGVEGHVSGSC
jgi:hypothetical protein